MKCAVCNHVTPVSASSIVQPQQQQRCVVLARHCLYRVLFHGLITSSQARGVLLETCKQPLIQVCLQFCWNKH